MAARRIRKTTIDAAYEQLRAIREYATFERATFAPVGMWGPEAAAFDDNIRATTKLYRDTWIVAELDAILLTLAEELERPASAPVE